MMSKTAAEPLVRISKREGTTFVQKVLVRAIAILLALVVDAFFIFFVTGLNPISVYGVMWNGTFMNTTRFSWALRDLSSLLCIAIALAPAFKMRFWNIGGEGQVLIGGLVAALIMVYFGSSLPAPLLFAAMVIGSVLAGAIWAFVPAWFKSRWNTNETLFTLMMNYVATSIVACMTNIMRGQASSLGTLNKATKAGWLPVINGQRYTINIIVVLVLTFAMYAYLKYSKQGYEISVVGESENTARYAGINVSRYRYLGAIIGGGIGGLMCAYRIAERDREGGDRLRGAELAGGVQVGRKGGGGRAGREGDEPRFEDALEEGHDRYACRDAHERQQDHTDEHDGREEGRENEGAERKQDGEAVTADRERDEAEDADRGVKHDHVGDADHHVADDFEEVKHGLAAFTKAGEGEAEDHREEDDLKHGAFGHGLHGVDRDDGEQRLDERGRHDFLGLKAFGG